MPESDKQAPPIFRILFQPMIQLPNVLLLKKPQHAFFQLAAALARNDFDLIDPFGNGLIQYILQGLFDLVALIKNIMKIQFQFRHGSARILRQDCRIIPMLVD